MKPFVHYITKFLSNRQTLAFVVIFFTLLIFNIAALFADYLEGDDPFWYYKGNQSLNPLNYLGNRGNISVFKPLRDWFYSAGMVLLGLPAIRAIHLLVMMGISMMFFRILTVIFKLDWWLALGASILPNILSSMATMPTGLNKSYAMWGLLPILIGIWYLYRSNNVSDQRDRKLLILAFFFYALGLHMNPSANFLIPLVLFSLIIFSRKPIFNTVLTFLPFLALGLLQVYLQSRNSHLSPTILSLNEIFQRIIIFIQQSNMWPFATKVTQPLQYLLIIIGSISLVKKAIVSHNSLSTLPMVKNLHQGQLLFLWIMVWVIGNGITYVALSPTFRAFDYAYVFNFGLILFQIIGIGYIGRMMLFYKNQKTWKEFLLGGIITIIILSTGIQRIQNTKTTDFLVTVLRETCHNDQWPPESQIILLTEKAPNDGALPVNTGIIMYATNRQDLTALLGREEFPASIFDKRSGWKYRFKGMSTEKPMYVYKEENGSLVRLSYIMHCEGSQNPTTRNQFWLYDVSSGSLPRLLGKGFDPTEVLNQSGISSPGQTARNMIAFYNEDFWETESKVWRNTSPDPLQLLYAGNAEIGDHLILKQVSLTEEENGSQLHFILGIYAIIPDDFRLELRVNKSKKRVPIVNYAKNGDNIYVNMPLGKTVNHSISIMFINVIGYPQTVLPIKLSAEKQLNSLTLHPDQVQPRQ